MSKIKTQPTDQDPAEFIAAIPDAQKQADARVVCEMMERLAGAPPVMWGPSIVGFGSYHYVYASGREGDWMETGFSPRKNALTLYLMAGVNRDTELLEKLGKYKTGKSCLYIKKLDDVDSEVLEALLKRNIDRIRNKDIDYG